MASLKREAPGGSPAFRGHADLESSLRSVSLLGTESIGAAVGAIATGRDRSTFGDRFHERARP
jgi:hypothetical protein